MKFLKSAKKALILPIFGVFFGVLSTPIQAMQTRYGQLSPKRTWIPVDMNEGRSIAIPAHYPKTVTLWTDFLKGCVVTLINLTHQNGDHRIAMSHYAPFAKDKHGFFLHNFVTKLKQENALNTIIKASCTIIPPGVVSTDGKAIIPVLDEEWHRLIVSILQTKIPSMTFEIHPYLFNLMHSSVKYSLKASRAKTLIINQSQIMDRKNKGALFDSHNIQAVNTTKIIAMLLIVAFFAALFNYR